MLNCVQISREEEYYPISTLKTNEYFYCYCPDALTRNKKSENYGSCLGMKTTSQSVARLLTHATVEVRVSAREL